MYSLHDVIAKLVQQKRRGIRAKVLRYESNLFGCRYTFDDFLGSPGAILVNTDGAQMRGQMFEHGNPGGNNAFFEKLLDDLCSSIGTVTEVIACLNPTYCVTQPVRRKVDNLSVHHVMRNLFDFLWRDNVGI